MPETNQDAGEPPQTHVPDRDLMARLATLRAAMGRIILGQDRVLDQVLITLLCGGHALLEGVPGTAKTLTVRVLARVLSCQMKRIQFTPDLMPADIIGTNRASAARPLDAGLCHGGRRHPHRVVDLMAADLTFAGQLSRHSLVIEPSYLVVLEHGTLRDRTRRILYDRVESVLVWRRPPWGRIIVISLLLGGPALLLLFLPVGQPVVTGLALFVLLLAVAIVARYVTWGCTYIQITRDGEARLFKGVVWPKRRERFLARLTESIRTAQATEASSESL